MPEPNPSIQVLQVSVDEEDDSYVRLLVDDKLVKYVTIATGVYAVEDMCFAPALIPLLPTLPAEDWNVGFIDKDPTTGNARFACTAQKQLAGVTRAWHPRGIDHLDLEYGENLRSGVYEVRLPEWPFTAVAKFACFEWEIGYLEKETIAYEWIDGRGIGPAFIAHLTEQGRIIGFLVEHITDAKHATIDDLDACARALDSLHHLGVVHGDTNKHNFLVKDGLATLIDFDCARKDQEEATLRQEMESLPQQLASTSGLGGTLDVTAGM